MENEVGVAMEGHHWQRTLDAITRIHRAGLVPDTWPAALEAVATALDAGKAVMFGVDLRGGAVSGLRTHNIDGNATDRFSAYYHRLDPWLQGFDIEQRPREPIPGTWIISDTALRRTEYYNDFIKPLDMRFALTGFPVKTARWMELLTVFRGVRQKDFDADSLQVYQILLEHAAQAMAVQRTVGRLRAHSNGLATALEQVTRPVILLNRNFRVVYANPAAEKLLADGDGLRVRYQRLEAAGPEGRKALGSLLQQTADSGPNNARLKQRAAVVPRRSGRRPYVVRVAPVSTAEDIIDVSDLHERPRWLMMISDPEADRPRPAPGDLRAVYGLTPAEASLTACLAGGTTVSEIAAQQDIAVDTARKRLKAVFEKTRTHRQTELVQRVLSDFGGL